MPVQNVNDSMTCDFNVLMFSKYTFLSVSMLANSVGVESLNSEYV